MDKLKGVLTEFRDFAVKGNAVDMAVGIIIGGAFGKIVASLVNDVIMPPIGMLVGGMDFSNLSIPLQKAIVATKTTPAVAAVSINYGKFITNVLDFVIIAFCIFLVIKQMNMLIPKPAAEATTKTCPQCQSEIPIKAVRCAHCTSMLEN